MKEEDTYQTSSEILKRNTKLSFDVPEGYFDELADRIMESSTPMVRLEQGSQSSFGPLKWGIAASILLVCGMFIGREFLTRAEPSMDLIGGYESVDDYLLADDNWLEELYLEEMIAEENSVELDFLLDDIDQEGLEELYLNEL